MKVLHNAIYIIRYWDDRSDRLPVPNNFTQLLWTYERDLHCTKLNNLLIKGQINFADLEQSNISPQKLYLKYIYHCQI